MRLIDQTRLPAELVYVDCRTPEEVAHAIRTMQIRGAPAIGCAAAFGLALCARRSNAPTGEALVRELAGCADVIAATRPTAVNLFWALERVMAVARRMQSEKPCAIADAVIEEAQRILREDIDANRRLGEYGAELLERGSCVLTHCNAGALATGGYGTALGVIRSAHAQGKIVRVYVDETRPLLQGARLTAWELLQEDIPAVLITDSMAGFLMQQGKVNAAIVGADRIARNGDVANKIGTYSLAVIAREHNVPFYVAAPLSTVDSSCETGAAIPIEQRSSDEVTEFAGKRIAPMGIEVCNPAFDVTPAHLVTAIVTEAGVIHKPADNLADFISQHKS